MFFRNDAQHAHQCMRIVLLDDPRHDCILLPQPRDDPEGDFVLSHDDEVSLRQFGDRNVGFGLAHRASQGRTTTRRRSLRPWRARFYRFHRGG